MRRSNEPATASSLASFPLGSKQRIESGDTAFSYKRNIHPTHDRGLLPGSKVPGKISQVVCFIDGACSREDAIRRVFKELVCLLAESSISAILSRACMFGGVMDLETLTKPAGFCNGKDLVERGQRVHIQVIHHQDDLLGLWRVLVRQAADKLGPILFGPLRSDHREALTSQRLTGEKHVTHALPFVLIVF